MKNMIHLVSGGSYNFTNPELSVYTIEDIARNLSHINRFTGSTEVAYNVSQHSVYVSLLLEAWGHQHLAMEGLLHDAVEAFTGDVSRPLKDLLPDYRKIELKNEKAIFAKYNLPFPMDFLTKQADNAVFVAERRDLQPKCPQGMMDKEGNVIQAAPFKIVPWSAKKSEKEFLKRFYELGGENK